MKQLITPAPLIASTLLLGLLMTACAAKDTAHNNGGGNNGGTGGGHTTTDTQFIEKLARLNSKNPVSDAQSAIAAGKRYFLCNIGRSRTVPGLSAEEYQRTSQSCTTQCLDGVTDAVLGDNHLHYLQAAVAYSASWNKVMINVCR